MNAIWWLVLGLVIGLIGMLPVVRFLLRRAELRARSAERRARTSERLAELGSMTSGLAHEIKNPLSTIGLNAQLLSEGLSESELPVEQRERLQRRLGSLSREVERLRGILTDFLQFAGRIKLDAQRHDVNEIISEVCDFFHPQCDQANVMLRTQLPGHAVFAEVDEGHLKQALLNLMINAVDAMRSHEPVGNGIQKGEGGHRRGDLMLRLEDTDPNILRIHVIDTGPGFEPEKLERIFQPYVSGKAGGTGLGLPTARRIIEEHGGHLTAHSEVGRGSDFCIELPRNQPQTPPKPQTSAT